MILDNLYELVQTTDEENTIFTPKDWADVRLNNEVASNKRPIGTFHAIDGSYPDKKISSIIVPQNRRKR
jgi:hypothetical protein